MKPPLTRGEKWLFSLPILFAAAWGGWQIFERTKPFNVVYEPGWEVRDVAFSPDGQRLALHVGWSGVNLEAGKWDHKIEVREVKSGRLLTQCDIPKPSAQWFQGLVWSPDAKKLVCALSGDAGSTNNTSKYRVNLAAWNSQTGELENNTPWMSSDTSDSPIELRFFPGNRLAVVSKSVSFANANSLQVEQWLPWHSKDLAQIQLNPSHNLWATVNYRLLVPTVEANSGLHIWNLQTRNKVRDLPLQWVEQAAWSHSGDELAVLQAHNDQWPSGQCGQLSLWNYDGSSQIWKAPFRDCRLFNWSTSANQFAINRVDFSQKIVENRSKDNPANFLKRSTVEWWDVTRKKCLWSHPLSGWLESLKISADGRWLLGVEDFARSANSKRSWDEILWVWDTKDGAIRLRRVTSRLSCIRWAPQASKLIVADEQRLEMLDFSETNVGTQLED